MKDLPFFKKGSHFSKKAFLKNKILNYFRRQYCFKNVHKNYGELVFSLSKNYKDFRMLWGQFSFAAKPGRENNFGIWETSNGTKRFWSRYPYNDASLFGWIFSSVTIIFD